MTIENQKGYRWHKGEFGTPMGCWWPLGGIRGHQGVSGILGGLAGSVGTEGQKGIDGIRGHWGS